MRIFVETQNADTLMLSVEEEDSVRAVKEKIKMAKKIPVDEQTLQYNGRELKDNEKLDQCAVYRDATLQLLIKMPRSTTL